MTNKQGYFSVIMMTAYITMIIIILFLIFFILNYKYKELQINIYIENKIKLNKEFKNKIITAENIIEYKSSKAYRNKILKEQQGLKGKGEKVIYLSSEKEYNKYTKSSNIKNNTIITREEKIREINDITKTMNIYQKWVYFIFRKDLR